MENSNLFYNKITDLFARLGFPYISELEAILILVAVFFVLLFILWLVFRKARLWYWKTNIQIETLKSIDIRLHNVEEKLSQDSVMDAKNAESESADQSGTEPSMETVREEFERQEIFSVGKSGRIYTEAELELQIRE